MKRLIVILCLLSIICIGVNAQSKVTIKVTGFEQPSGKLYIALFNSDVPFLSGEGVGKVIEVTKKKMDVTFDNLEEDEYAVTMFYDENGDGKLDLNSSGRPTEKYGFSNNIDPAVLKRSPVFDECKFLVKGNTKISVKLISAIKK